MPGNDCAGSVQLCALRVARLEANGVPSPGANNLYVTDNMIRLRANPVVRSGEEVELPNGCGDLIVNYKTPDSLKWYEVELEMGAPDPELEELLVGGTVLTLASNTVGHDGIPLGQAFGENGVSLEAWSKAVDGSNLADEDPYWRWIFPKVYNWRPSTVELANGALVTTYSGIGIGNTNFFDGPLNDLGTITDGTIAGGMARVRDPILPAASCGYQTLAAS